VAFVIDGSLFQITPVEAVSTCPDSEGILEVPHAFYPLSLVEQLGTSVASTADKHALWLASSRPILIGESSASSPFGPHWVKRWRCIS
jgi:hypothetical protein